jgi:hypothetical protein
MSFNQKYQKHGFDLPKDYFNTLENKLLENTLELGAPRRNKPVIRMKTTFWVATAAAIALVFWLLPIDANKAEPDQGPLTQDNPVESEFFEKDEDSWTQYAELHLSAEDFIPILTPEDIDLLLADSQEWDELSKQSTNIEYLFEEFNLIP